MKRRHRRVLFNAFAFSLLGASIYLNMFCMGDQSLLSIKTPAKRKADTEQVKTDKLSKIIPARSSLSAKPS